jgi:hypothetical protein
LPIGVFPGYDLSKNPYGKTKELLSDVGFPAQTILAPEISKQGNRTEQATNFKRKGALMNQSRFSTLAAAAAALAAQMALPQGAQAGVLPITRGVPTAIDGLDVDGTVYNVTFVPDTGAPVPQFKTATDALTASTALGNALGNELLTLLKTATPSSLSIFTAFGDSKNVLAYELVLGSNSINSVSTLFEILGPGSFSTSNATASELLFQPQGLFQPAPFVPNGAGDYAIWTPATIPEPSSWVLMGVGMAGVAAAGAARRKRKSA